MPLHRLFVGNIPGGTSEQELKNEFSSYGPVRAIDLKSKANPLTGSDDTFAFVNIDVDERTLRQLLDEFRQERYKGVYLNVSRAKESFLDRLKREREEAEAAKEKSGLLNPYKKEEVESKVVVKEALPALPTIAKEVESSSEESSDESDEDEKPVPVRSVPTVRQKQQGEEDQLVRKWNQETYIEHGKLKIAFTSGEVKEVIDKSKNRRQPEKELADKARVADEKRKQGLTKLQSAYDQQKLAIQAALAGAEKGQRLYEMQTQFHGDSRFKLDERFLADDDSAAGRRKRKALEKEKATLDSAVSGAKPPANGERRKQMEILSKMTGREIQDGARSVPDQKSMQRFDPSAQKGKEPARVEKKAKVLTEEEIIAAKKAERPEETFAVSEEKFFQVAQDLTQVIGQSSGGFSLLSMFGSAARPEEDEEEEVEQEKSLGKPAYSDARFKYESSDSEDEVEGEPESPVQEVPQEPEVAAKKKDRKPGYYSKQGIWKENFFFLPDDVRLEEGRKFFLEFATEPAAAADAGRKEQARDIRKIFKKRRMRETKNVNQLRARRGLKLMKGKRK
ncbi:l-caldesmon [Culex quinquefasciatus]|uniref:L-caldesmon n=1 Tax=Culex quinquefasciatus TaxID=7176 RepID=B0W2D8_CULQU|nr:l-caldesmon [Culex quinquefasciatus]|eukprot:XP_001842841.1 l-caldesmon [Culex quinquefasciatus]